MTKLVVLGPNLMDQTMGSFHVHAEGCADIKRSPIYRSREHDADKKSVYDFSSETEVVEFVYSDFVDENNPAESFLSDFYFFPCVHFTPKEETEMRTVTFELFGEELFFEMIIETSDRFLADVLAELSSIANVRNIKY